MRKRSEIAARTDRALLRNDRINVSIEHFTKQLNNFQPNSAKAERKHVCPQQNHRPHLGLGQRISNSAGVAADKV